ncbi:MAG: hypothetical protein KGD64_03270 [Candidatus Heimdallarchaeota archaeon]|nr:hypothetical protein [Candidatus Heimdallarchaeota archaeon]
MSRKPNVTFYILFAILSVPLISSNTLSFDHDTNVNIRSEIINDPRVQEMIRNDPSNPTQVLKMIENLENERNPPTDLIVELDAIKQDVINDVESFWIVTDFYTVTYSEISATLLAIGANSYIYVANSIVSSVGTTNARTRAEQWRDEFENKIYPNNLLYFGSPDGYLGDIDEDHHVTVLLATLSAEVAGYFDPNNERSGPQSNMREMVYVDYDYNRFSVLAHELQHLTHYNYDPDEYWWIDEGCSELSTYLNGYALATNLTEFARDYFQYNPEDSLLYWNYYDEGGENVRTDYGSAYMFMFYVSEKYGIAAVRNLVSETSNGPLSVEIVLQGLGFPIDFNELYLNWITALNVDDPSIGDGLYGFENLDINIDYELISIFPSTKTDRLNRFYGMYVAKLVSPSDFLLLEVSPPGSYSLAISVAVHDINGWTVSQRIHDTDLDILMNGTLVDTVYVITSIVTSTTPAIPLTGTSQFGLGYTDELDYTYIPGKPLTINTGTLDYQSSSWDFSLSDIYIEDENSTEVTDASGISVFLQFDKTGTTLTTENLELSYDPIDKWYVEENLQYFYEGDYELSIVASGLGQYGEQSLTSINIAHLLTVETPTISLINSTALYVFTNSSYTQLYGWESFTNNVETYVLLYDDSDTPVGIFDIYYDQSSNSWESDLLIMDEYNGEYYIKISFKYAGRTVRSAESEHFQLEGEISTPTNGIAFPFLQLVLMMSLSAFVFLKKKSKQ